MIFGAFYSTPFLYACSCIKLNSIQSSCSLYILLLLVFGFMPVPGIPCVRILNKFRAQLDCIVE